MQVWNVLHAARCKYRTQKRRENHHLGTIAQLCRAISLQLRHVSTIGKKIVKQQYLLHMPHNMANFGPLTAEIGSGVCGTPTHFNGFCVLCPTVDIERKLGRGGPFGEGELGPNLTQCSLDRRLSWYQMTSWSNQWFDYNIHIHSEPQKRGSIFLTITLANLNRFL